MTRNNRIGEEEFTVIRRHYDEVGANSQSNSNKSSRDVPGNEGVPEAIRQLWRMNSDQQLRRRVRDAVQSRVEE